MHYEIARDFVKFKFIATYWENVKKEKKEKDWDKKSKADERRLAYPDAKSRWRQRTGWFFDAFRKPDGLSGKWQARATCVRNRGGDFARRLRSHAARRIASRRLFGCCRARCDADPFAGWRAWARKGTLIYFVDPRAPSREQHSFRDGVAFGALRRKHRPRQVDAHTYYVHTYVAPARPG